MAWPLAMALEVRAELFGNEADSLADAHRRQFVPFEQAMDLSTGDAQKHGRGGDVQERLERRPVEP
jgi:hypothetical protein